MKKKKKKNNAQSCIYYVLHSINIMNLKLYAVINFKKANEKNL